MPIRDREASDSSARVTDAALTKAAVRSSPRPSTACLSGINCQAFATPTLSTCPDDVTMLMRTGTQCFSSNLRTAGG